MRRLVAMLALIAGTVSTSRAAAVEPTFEVGVGLPELVHLRVGAFVHPRVSVQIYASNVIFNWLLGVTATGYFAGEARLDGPPPHALATRLTLAINPVADPISIRSGGERIGSAVLVEGGYAYTADSGFMFNAMLGAVLLYGEGAGPTASVGVGLKF